jgi:hypothetical protein
MFRDLSRSKFIINLRFSVLEMYRVMMEKFDRSSRSSPSNYACSAVLAKNQNIERNEIQHVRTFKLCRFVT